MDTVKKEEFLNIDTSLYKTIISSKFKNRKKYIRKNPKVIPSYIPGTILEIFITPGQQIRKGDDLMILDAMKMKNRVRSSIDGTVKSISVEKGTRVSKGTVLLELK